MRILLLLAAVVLRGQSPAFDVASIKAANVKSSPVMRVNPRGIEYIGTLRGLIAAAYSVNPRSLSSPDAHHAELLDQMFNVVARSDHDLTKDQLNLMMQALLADRFQLTLHHGSKVEAVYKLIAAPGGPKLAESAAEGDSGCAIGPNRTAKCSHETMASLSAYLTARMSRVVLDQTGLKGAYDFTLQLDGIPSIDDLRSAISSGGDPATAKRTLGTAMNDWTTSSIFTDLPKQLGLKLESDKAPVDNLVVERVEKPSEN
jgi:uncharacterized protein (TIGR03435 family)